MKTLKRIVVALALSAAACTTIGAAQAGEYCQLGPSSGCYAPSAYVPVVPMVHPVCRTYTIYYRECVNSPWVAYGRVHRIQDAMFAANYIEDLGYETFIR